MKITTEEFITNFHSLTGTTVGERQKNFYTLLNKIRENQHVEIDFSLLQPRTPLEEKLKVDSLIYFKRIPELLELLKCENPILIERVLKASDWFVEEAFQNINGLGLVNSIFPHISFNAKVKLLNKIALHLNNSERADEYFKHVQEKYGFFLASKLIPCCSLNVVMNCIKVNRLKMLPKHLLLIVKKQPNITEVILKELKGTGKINPASDYKIVFKYIAETDAALFLKLNKEYKTSVRLGWRITDKYVQKNKEVVINDPEHYFSILHNKQIAKSLNKDFQRLYLGMFPSSVNQFSNCYYRIMDLCNRLPKKICNVDLLLKTFKQAYGSDLWDHSDYVNQALLDSLSAEQREIVVKVEKRPSDVSEEKWYTYMKPEISLPYLKKTISLSSNIKTRVELIPLLVQTCKINNDSKALANLCTYMITKHRNDHMSVRLAFLKAVKKYFKLQDLEAEHWAPINEMIEIFILNDEEFYHHGDFIEGYIWYKLKNNLDVEEDLKKYLKVSGVSNYSIIKEKPEYEKKCLLAFGNLLSVVFDESQLEHQHISFLNCVLDWNKRHPEDLISIFNYKTAMDRVKSFLKDEKRGYNYGINTIVQFCIFKLNADSEERKEILKYYFTENEDASQMVKVTVMLLRTEPLTVKNSIEVITKILLKSHSLRDSTNIWNYFKYFTHLEIPQEIIKICKNSPDLSVEEEYQRECVIKNTVLVLVSLLPSQEFNNFFKNFYPTQLTAEAKTKENKRLYLFQQNIGKYVKYVKPASQSLEIVSVFCKGDYLKLVRSSLYSICNNVNEDKLIPFFTQLSNRAVSVRKHAMHLTLRVLDKEHIFSILRKFMDTEKNASIRKFIFKSIFNFFVQNPSDYSWEMFKSNMNAVDMNDNEAVEILMQIDKIPSYYFVKYFLFTWDVINSLPIPQHKKETKFSQLLRSVQDLNLLPKEFCEKIINTYFLKDTTGLTSFQSVVNTFVCKFVIYCNDDEQEQIARLISNFEIVKSYTSSKLDDLEQRATRWNYVSDVLKEFCKPYISDKSDNVQILRRFSELWKDSFPPHKAISEYLHLELTLIYVQKLALVETGRKLAELCNELANMYGNIIVPVFSKKIIFFYDYFLPSDTEKSNLEKITLIEGLLFLESSTACLLLIIMLLDNGFNIEHMDDGEVKTKYEKIMEILKKQSDPAIQVYYNNHIRHTTTLDYH